MKITLVCPVCGKSFERYECHIRGKTCCCSQKCWLSLHNNPERNLKVSIETAEQRGNVLRGRGNKKSYRKSHGKHEHRYVMEQHIGRSLTSNEIAHHIDGDRYNNDISNLKIVTRQEHIEIHRSEMVKSNREKHKGVRQKCSISHEA